MSDQVLDIIVAALITLSMLAGISNDKTKGSLRVVAATIQLAMIAALLYQ